MRDSFFFSYSLSFTGGTGEKLRDRKVVREYCHSFFSKKKKKRLRLIVIIKPETYYRNVEIFLE